MASNGVMTSPESSVAPMGSDLLASALVSHSTLPAAAAQFIATAFLSYNVSELKIVLAQGTNRDFSIYPVIAHGTISTDPLEESGSVPQNSLAAKAVETGDILVASSTDSTVSGMEDWVGMQRDGCTWALASPLACEDEACERLLGAVLVGGGGDGGENRIDKEWLHEWCCELAHAITHASISVMESSLDMLRSIFPPKVVENLLFNAVSSQPVDDSSQFAELLSAAATGDSSITDIPDASNLTTPTFKSGSTAAAIGPPSGRLFSEDTGPAEIDPAALIKTTPGRSLHPRNHHHHRRHHSQTENEATTSTLPPARPAFRSPFAAFTGSPIRTSSDSEGSGAAGPVEPRSISLPLSYSSNAAAALLRQASSIPFVPALDSADGDDECISPTYSEIEGYEDLVSEDTKMSASRRPSFCMDQAVSKDYSGAVAAASRQHIAEASSTPGKRECIDIMAVADGATTAARDIEQDPNHRRHRHSHCHHFEQHPKEDITDLPAGLKTRSIPQDTGQNYQQGHHEKEGRRHSSLLTTITEGPSQTELTATPSSPISSVKNRGNVTTRIDSLRRHRHPKDSARAIQDDDRARVRSPFFTTLFYHTSSSDFIALMVVACALLLMGMLNVYLCF